MDNFAKNIFETYSKYKETKLKHRRIKHKDILPLIFKRTFPFHIQEIGKSFDSRKIFLLKAGYGDTKILLWSQMHGNESTATQALFDIFNFLENKPDFIKEKEEILQNCTLYFIPMLNPDGAEYFKRRNSQEIDINRDAQRLVAPESNILMNLRDEINADFGFNLHDQDLWYSAGNTKHPATLSFLAPTFNFEKDINESRKRSMKIISSMNNMLQEFIPNQTAKYDDGFMPNAFGDNIQKKGTSTILLESGGYVSDPEKQFVRKLNFVSILYSLKIISNNTFEKEEIENYQNIPFNKKNKLFNYIIRNATVKHEHGEFLVDIGIRSEVLAKKDIFKVDDIGDLSQNYAYQEIDLKMKKIKPIKLEDDAQKLINLFFKS